MYNIPKLPLDSFDWIRWRSGIDIWIKTGIHPRWYSIIDNRKEIRKYAVGYIHESRLFCRPELNEMAVMFLIDDVFSWTHFRKEEFEEVFSVR